MSDHRQIMSESEKESKAGFKSNKNLLSTIFPTIICEYKYRTQACVVRLPPYGPFRTAFLV